MLKSPAARQITHRRWLRQRHFNLQRNPLQHRDPANGFESVGCQKIRPRLKILANYDTSAFQAFDPWLGLSTTPVVEQQVFIRRAELPHVKADPKSWTDRFVVQRMPFPGESHFSSRAFTMWTIEDFDRQRCHEGLTRKLLSLTKSEMVYESKFSNCPQKFPLGPDRVVLTRVLMGQKSWRAGMQQIYIFSYEVIGAAMTNAQREEGMRLISTPHLAAPGEAGTTLRFANSEPGESPVVGMP